MMTTWEGVGFRDRRRELPTRSGMQYHTRSVGRIYGIDIHCTGGPPMQTVLQFTRYQIGPSAPFFFPGVSYHWMITYDGTLHYVNDLSLRVWHNEAMDRNESCVAICYTGSVEPNPVQKQGMMRAIQLTERLIGRELEVLGHKDSWYTQCPGMTWPDWKDEIIPYGHLVGQGLSI